MAKMVKIENDEIAIIWSVDDVLQECDWLNKEQAMEVLHDLKHNHDATIGINWDVIRYKADGMYPDNETEEG